MPIFRLSDELIFPPPNLAGPEGLLAVGGDLSPERLLLAYKQGIFPWYSDDDPILWWSPDPRLVIYLEELKVSRSLAKTIRRQKYTITIDTDFRAVIEGCAKIRGKNRDETWITDEMSEAYIELHKLGYAHSVETRYDDSVVGGLYGVSLGRAFFGESMFSIMSDASKVALVYLRDFLQRRRFDFIDCQMPTDHLLRMGAREVKRRKFMHQLNQSIKYTSLTGPWHFEQLSSGLA